MLYLQREGQAPFIAMALLLVIAMIGKRTRLDFRGFLSLFENIGRLLAEIVGILAACGFIIGAMSITGVGSSFSRELVALAGGIPVIMLLFGALASYVLGMGMTISACYIFLAIVLAPGLIEVGFNVLAVHLFILYWATISFITPPVAIGSYAAAGLAGANAMKTGFTSMRLGVIIYLVPFFFVFSPSLVFQGTISVMIYQFFTCIIGIILIAGGAEGFLLGVGLLGVPYRLLSLISGLLIAVPDWQSDAIGAVIATVMLILLLLKKRREHNVDHTTQCRSY